MQMYALEACELRGFPGQWMLQTLLPRHSLAGPVDLRDLLVLVMLVDVGEGVLITEHLLLEFVNFEDILVRATVSVLMERLGPGELGTTHYSAGIIAVFTGGLW